MDYFVNGVLDIGGVKTSELAKKYASDHRVDYITALRAVVREQSTQQRRYAVENQLEGRSRQLLGSLVGGLPKQSDGSIDSAAAVKVINGSAEYLDIARAAAGEHLDALAQRLAGSSHLGERISFLDALRAVQRDNVDVAQLYNGGKVTESALKSILWSQFKYSQSSSRTSLKVYSADRSHISYDSAGNEIHRYDLVVDHRR